jgi:hypothetical protein
MMERPTLGFHSRILTACARVLAASIEQEVAFRSWVKEERENKREARKIGKPYRDLYEALRRSTKTINGPCHCSTRLCAVAVLRRALSLPWLRWE